jgi:hypothetical protein
MPLPSATTEIFPYDLYNEFLDVQTLGPKVQISSDAYISYLDSAIYTGSGDLGSSVACLPTRSLTAKEIDVIMALSEAPASAVTPMLEAVRRRLAQD